MTEPKPPARRAKTKADRIREWAAAERATRKNCPDCGHWADAHKNGCTAYVQVNPIRFCGCKRRRDDIEQEAQG